MTRRLKWLCICLGMALFVCTDATAQIQCAPRESMVSQLRALGEAPVAQGIAPGGQGVAEVWKTVDGAAWTFLITRVSGQSCIVSFGTAWMPVIWFIPPPGIETKE